VANDTQKQLEILTSGTAEVLPEDGLKAKLSHSLKTGEPLIVKLGVDPTAPDLHLGHAVPLRKLRQFQDLGHQAVLIIGDFTAMIGDPSGRTVTRPQLTKEQVAANARTYTEQAFKILDAQKTQIRYNSEWFAKMDFRQVIELTARFTVAGLLVREDFIKRYQNEQPIGLHEFLYPVMQAYDSVVLKADVEIGGTDQKFNLLAGRELQEKLGLEPQVALTLPLLEGTDGVRKMSKSYDNHIGLTFPPAEMFGKVMSIPDEATGQPRYSLIVKYYQLALGYLPEQIKALEKELNDGSLDPMEAKLKLAEKIVATYWGADAGKKELEAFLQKFRYKKVEYFEPKEVYLPTTELKAGKIWVVKLLRLANLAPSNAEARRLIEQKAVRLIRDKQEVLLADSSADIEVKEGDLIRAGKRKFAAIHLH
jgi:tyrosyl-tRNA synthetase